MSEDAKQDHNGGGHGPGRDYEIVVNGEEVTVRDANVSYEEAVEIAYPGALANPDHVFRVDFEDAASKPRSGTLVAGGKVEVKKRGTEFSVIRSVRS